jgi:peptide/nickel transport system permease protein
VDAAARSPDDVDQGDAVGAPSGAGRTDATPRDLRPDFQSGYILWIAARYAATGDADWAREKLGAEYWEQDQLADALEWLAEEHGGMEGLYLRELARALRSRTAPEAFGSGAGEPHRLVTRAALIVPLVMALIGGTYLVVQWLRRPPAAPKIVERGTRPVSEFALSERVSWEDEARLTKRLRGLRRFLFNWRNLVPLTIVGLFVAVAAAAPLLSPPDDPSHPTPFKLVESFDRESLPPGPDIPLGTAAYFSPPDTLLHFDVLHSLVWGTRTALRFGLTVALSTACFGVLVGAASGYAGGWINSLTRWITDAFLTFPVIAGVWLLRQIMETANLEIYYGLERATVSPTPLQRVVLALGIEPMMLALILFSWMPYARIINANVLRLKYAEYVQAARSVGASPPRIILRHLLPNAIAPAIVLVARDIGGMVIMQTAFTFIGLSSGSLDSGGVTEWARLLLLGRDWIIGYGGNSLTYWWLYLPATLALLLFGIGWNILGDRLNTMLNPWEARRGV